MSVFWGTSSLAVESLPDIPMTLSSITRQEGKKKEQTKERGEVDFSLVPPNETIPGLDLSTLLFQISGPTNWKRTNIILTLYNYDGVLL